MHGERLRRCMGWRGTAVRFYRQCRILRCRTLYTSVGGGVLDAPMPDAPTQRPSYHPSRCGLETRCIASLRAGRRGRRPLRAMPFPLGVGSSLAFCMSYSRPASRGRRMASNMDNPLQAKRSSGCRVLFFENCVVVQPAPGLEEKELRNPELRLRLARGYPNRMPSGIIAMQRGDARPCVSDIRILWDGIPRALPWARICCPYRAQAFPGRRPYGHRSGYLYRYYGRPQGSPLRPSQHSASPVGAYCIRPKPAITQRRKAFTPCKGRVPQPRASPWVTSPWVSRHRPIRFRP
jgi:hypothetical protein